MAERSTQFSAAGPPATSIPGHAEVGQVIAGYRIEARAGAGGMGVVYRASEPELGRRVALKLIAPEYASDPRVRQLLQEESRKAAALEHPNVIPIYRSGEADGQLFIAMRYVDGSSLQELIDDLGRLPVGRAIRIVSSVADALDAAHAAGLVHRDVKPSNTLIADPDGDEHVYLSDFGLSVRAADGQVIGDRPVGTLAYLSPEQIRGPTVDARADVYSLGCVFFHALTGRVPFPGPGPAKIAAHLGEPPPRVTDLVPGLPRRLDDVVAKALAKLPEDRYASAGELAQAARDARADVLVCHGPGDAAAAVDVAERLRAAGLEARLAGPEPADEMLAAQACYLLVGRARLGEWAGGALAAATDVLHADRGFVLASVLLPGAPEPFDPSLAFLADRPLVDLRAGLDEPHAGDDLLRPLGALPRPPAGEGGGDACPYRGLEPFTEEDAELFFGRDQDVARLLARMHGTRFLAVLGASGSGKSSLVRAGLVPALRRTRPGLRVLTLTPGDAPLSTLSASLGGFPSADQLRRVPRALQRALAGGQVLLVVDQLEELFTLTADPRERRAALDALVHAATIPGGETTVVVAMRSDFYPRAAEHPGLRALIASQQYLVGPLDREGLRQAIEEPARRAGLELEPGLTRRILADVSDRPGALPLLEHLLLELWHRRRGRLLTLEAYAAAGGVEGSLAKRANQVYAAFDPDQQAIARRVLLRLTQPGEGTEDTRRRAELDGLATEEEERPRVEAVVAALSAARLVTVDSDRAHGSPTVEVAHEALIRGWPELRRWIDQDRDALRLHRRLSDAAAEWNAGGREDGHLYRGARLAAWGEQPTGDLNPLERSFLSASREQAARERGARRKRLRLTIGGLVVALAAVGGAAGFAFVQADNAQREGDTALSRQLAGSSTVVRQRDPELAVLLAERGYAVKPTVEAESALRQAVHESRVRGALRMPQELPFDLADAGGGRVAIASESGILRIWDPRRDPRGAAAVTLGRWPSELSALARVGDWYVTGDYDGNLVWWRQSPSGDVQRTVRRVEGGINGLGASPDGRQVVIGSDEGLWLAGPPPGAPRRVASGAFSQVAFDPVGGGYLAVMLDYTLQRFRPGASAPESIPVSGSAYNLALSPEGRLLAVAAHNGLHLFRLSPQPSLIHHEPLEGGANGASFIDGGRRLAVATGDNQVVVLDDRGRPLVRLDGHESPVVDVISTGPGRLVSVSNDNTARLWDWATGLDRELRGRSPASGGVAFGADGRVTVVELDGSSSIWDPSSGSDRPWLPPGGDLASAAAAADRSVQVDGLGFPGGVLVRAASGRRLASWELGATPWGVAYDPARRRVAAALDNGEVRLGTVGGPRGPAVAGSHDSAAFAVAFSPTDATLASGGRDGFVKVWGGPGGSRVLGQHAGQVPGVAFSPDGRWLASASADRTVRVWDLSGRKPPRVLRAHSAYVYNVAFTDDGRLVSRGLDGLRVWDWDGGVPLLALPTAAGRQPIGVRGDAPTIAHGDGDGVVRVSSCDVCGSIESVMALARQRTTRGLTDAERDEFNVDG